MAHLLGQQGLPTMSLSRFLLGKSLSAAQESTAGRNGKVNVLGVLGGRVQDIASGTYDGLVEHLSDISKVSEIGNFSSQFFSNTGEIFFKNSILIHSGYGTWTRNEDGFPNSNMGMFHCQAPHGGRLPQGKPVTFLMMFQCCIKNVILLEPFTNSYEIGFFIAEFQCFTEKDRKFI